MNQSRSEYAKPSLMSLPSGFDCSVYSPVIACVVNDWFRGPIGPFDE